MWGLATLTVLLVIAGVTLNIANTVIEKRRSDKPWYNNASMILGILSAVVVLAIALVADRSNKDAEHQSAKLRGNIESLQSQNTMLQGQNKTLSEQIGDCNARVQALNTKFHTPVHFVRGVTENIPTTDSLTVHKNK